MRMIRLLALSALIPLLRSGAARADDWPQWLGPQRDGVWREDGILEKFPDKGPKRLWSFEIGGGYAGPAVAGGKVFVTDFVRNEGEKAPKGGFGKGILRGVERVWCLDAEKGTKVWMHDYECPYRVSYAAGPRCTPTVDGERVYTLGTMGDLICFQAADGKVLWKHNFLKDYNASLPVWGFAAHPLVDGDKLICLVGGDEGRGVIAFNKMNGEIIWRALSMTEPGYCPPVIYPVGNARQLIIWHPKAVVGLDPESGKKLWNYPWEIQAGLSIPMPRLVDKDLLFLTSFYNGSTLLRLDTDKPGVSVVWKSKSKAGQTAVQPENTVDLHSIMPTPWIENGYIYGVCSYGEFRCLELMTGKRIWETHQPTTGQSTRWGNAFIIPHKDRFFLFNEKGELIIAKLSPKGYEEIDRAQVIEPTNTLAGRPVVWVHPAFADKSMFVRNDKEVIRVSLAR
jgi:outer membrane protein assembly factor BamB